MVAIEQVRIAIEAEKALTHWKSRFADEVCERAERLAAESGQPSFVTLSHYRQAAVIALESLSNAIHQEDSSDGQQDAA